MRRAVVLVMGVCLLQALSAATVSARDTSVPAHLRSTVQQLIAACGRADRSGSCDPNFGPNNAKATAAIARMRALCRRFSPAGSASPVELNALIDSISGYGDVVCEWSASVGDVVAVHVALPRPGQRGPTCATKDIVGPGEETCRNTRNGFVLLSYGNDPSSGQVAASYVTETVNASVYVVRYRDAQEYRNADSTLFKALAKSMGLPH